MNLGILTYHSAHNYGAILQAYGFQKFLESLGHDARFINFHPDDLEKRNQRRVEVSNIRQTVRRMAFALLSRHFSRRYSRFESFRHEKLKQTKRYRTVAELFADPPDFDAYICGSDQIWNVERGASPVNFLQFVPEGKARISYAPSFGTGTIPPDCEGVISPLLKAFNAISVREESGALIVARIIGKDVPTMIDPVFLISASEWSRILVPPSVSEDFIAFYCLESNRELTHLVSKLRRELKCPAVILGKGAAVFLTGKTITAIDSGPAEFLGWIQRAKCVVTNSFHATAFSILFNKPFMIVPHSTRNTRMENLLTKFDMSDTILAPGQDVTKFLKRWLSTVNTSSVIEAISIERERAGEFISAALR